MNVARDDFRAPQGLRADEFVLRPIRASDAQLDYEAVMESREFLRAWEQSTWPADDFTVEANREDLENLERRHADGVSFTYTVMDPAETQALGCVYVFPGLTSPTVARAQVSPVGDADWSDYEVAVYFWVRASRLQDGLDRRLLDALGPWLEHEWPVGRHYFLTNEQFEQQVAMLEDTDLQLRFRLDDPRADGAFLAYA